MRQASNAGNAAGFTLVELLVATALLGLVSVLLFSGMRFGAKVWDRSNAHLESADEVRVAQNLLAKVIGGAYPLYSVADPTHARITFTGARDRLELLAPPPASLGPGGLARYVFLAERGEAGLQLAMRVGPELAWPEDKAATPQEVLLKGLKSFSLSYLGGGRHGGGAGWQEDWAGATVLPRLVKINVEFAAGDARIWPELIVQPRIEVDEGCVYDRLTRYCRGRMG